MTRKTRQIAFGSIAGDRAAVGEMRRNVPAEMADMMDWLGNFCALRGMGRESS